MDRITQEANPDTQVLNELLFADDQCLIHHSSEELQTHTNNLNEACQKYNMSISIPKTETMLISRTPQDLNITINNIPLQQSKEFKYLGSIFTEDGKLDREIETKMSEGQQHNILAGPSPVTPFCTHGSQKNHHQQHLHPHPLLSITNLDHEQKY